MNVQLREPKGNKIPNSGRKSTVDIVLISVHQMLTDLRERIGYYSRYLSNSQDVQARAGRRPLERRESLIQFWCLTKSSDIALSNILTT